MRGLTCAVVCALAVGGSEPPAAAGAPPVRGLAYAGPALAGETVVWGESYPDGSSAVIARAPGERPRVLHRLPDVDGKGHTRGFGGIPGALSASPTRIAYALSDRVTRSTGSDTASSEVGVTAQLSVAGGAFGDPLPDCEGGYVSTAAEGDTVAIGYAYGDCAGVWIADSPPRRISAVPYLRQVRLAGPWVAWLADIDGGRQITVAEVATGKVVATYSGAYRRGVPEVFDLDDRGNVVAITYHGLIAFTVSDPRPRRLERHPWSTTVATAGGRVLYITQRRGQPNRRVLANHSGRVLRRLDRYGPARQPIHEVALTDRRAAWSVMRARGSFITGFTIRRGIRGSVLTARL